MAGGTSNLTWNLTANAVGYVAGMNKAHASTAKFKTELDKAEKSHRNMTRTIVSAAAAAAVVRFGVQSVKAYADAEKAQSRLSEAYRKFPKLADANIASLRALNGELQKKTRFDDDATAAAQANLAMYDLTGQQIATLTPLVQDLASAMGTDVTDAAGSLGKAFLGNARALKAVGIDFKATGDRAKDFDAIMAALTAKVGGFAESEGKTAAGQLAIMNNAVGELQESVGQALIPALTQMVNVVTPAVQSFTALPAPMRTAALAATALGGAALIAVPKVIALKTAMTEAGLATGKFGALAKGAGVVAVIASIGLVAKQNLDDLDAFNKALDEMGSTVNAGGVEMLQTQLASLRETMADPGAFRLIRSGWEYVFGIPNEIDVAADALARASQKYAQFQAAVSAVAWELKIPLTEAQDRVSKSGIDLSGTSAEVVARFREYERTAGAIAATTTDAADAWHNASGEAKSFKQALEDLNSPARDLAQSQIAVVEGAKRMADGLRDGSRSFSLSTEAGRANRENLLALTATIEEYGAAVAAKTKSNEKGRQAVLDERDALIKNLAAMTGNKEQAQKLVDKYLKVPPAADAATTAVKNLNNELRNMPKTVTVNVGVRTSGSVKAGGAWNSGTGSPFARGGMVRGPGTGTSDSVPAMLSNGEFVMRASAVQRHGAGFFHALNFADGGLVDRGFGEKTKGKAKSKSRTRSRSTSKASAGRDWSVRDALRDGAALDFDFTAYGYAVERAAAATRDLADADRGVAEARRRANAAGTPAERADAERDVAEALATQAAAGKELAAAEKAKTAAKPTGRNILAGFRARAAKLDKFRRDLKTLRGWGLSGVILKQLLDAGIDDGGDMAAALVKDRSVIAELNSVQGRINADARALNGPGSTGSGGGGSTGSSGTTGSSGSVAITFANAERPIVLKVDGEQVWKSLLHLKKAKGGASLGLG